MKKLIAMALASVMLLAGCGGGSSEGKNGVPQIGDLTGFIDSLDEVKKEADITVKAFRQKSSSSMVISDIIGLAAEIQSLLEG